MKSRQRQRGWGATEYIAILLSLTVVWNISQAMLTLIREHHDEFSWALVMPF